MVASSEIGPGGTFRIGRLPENCIPVKFAKFFAKDFVLSGEHLTIQFGDSSVTIKDENSRNGSLVDHLEIKGSPVVKSFDEMSESVFIQAGQNFNFRLSLNHDEIEFSSGKSSVLELEQSDFESRIVSVAIDEEYLDNLFD